MSKLFESDEDRDTWVILNAKRIQEFQRNINHQESPMSECLRTSRNQLRCDEESGKLRFSLEELQNENFDEHLLKIRQWHKDFINKHFNKD